MHLHSISIHRFPNVEIVVLEIRRYNLGVIGLSAGLKFLDSGFICAVLLELLYYFLHICYVVLDD